MLDLGVVPHILSLLEQHVDEGDVSVQHAGLSALRNLAIPGTDPQSHGHVTEQRIRWHRPNDASMTRCSPCLSASNKVQMLEDGVTERIKTLLRSDMPPVQFKLLGTLRMMVDGQGEHAELLPVANGHTHVH